MWSSHVQYLCHQRSENEHEHEEKESLERRKLAVATTMKEDEALSNKINRNRYECNVNIQFNWMQQQFSHRRFMFCLLALPQYIRMCCLWTSAHAPITCCVSISIRVNIACEHLTNTPTISPKILRYSINDCFNVNIPIYLIYSKHASA